MMADLGRHLQQQLGQVFERHAKVAQSMLEPADFALILVQAAVSMNLTVAATIATVTDSPEEAARMFDLMTDSIASLTKGDRSRSLEAIAAAKARKSGQ